MGNFRDTRSGGGRNFGRRSFDNNQDEDRQMFKTTCSNCGKECEVPFKPTGSKPVYCNTCFKTIGGSDRRTDDRNSKRPHFNNGNRNSRHPQYKEQFEALNAKLDKILKLLDQDNSPKKSKTPKTVVEEPIIAPEEKPVTPETSPDITPVE